ncbi:sensor histidine kinase [Nonomuraea sp. NPDC050790]|uniref:sensor histidine kinase n=1 Tax=Nonomuraea sp. NPDC050790 TaxID=3364371 RepID=UPI0037872A71
MDTYAALRHLREPAVQDAGLAAALLAATAVLNDVDGLRRSAGLPADGPWPVQQTIWWAATAGCVLAVAVRRRWPVAALVLACLGVVAHMAVIAGPTPADLAVPIVLYTVAERLRRAVALWVLGVALVAAGGWSAYVALDGRPDGWSFRERSGPEAELVARRSLGPTPLPNPGERVRTPLGPTDWGGVPVLVPVLVAGWATGSSVRSRRAYLAELTARARDLERERDQRAALAVAAERGRIARELHDVIAHGLSVIVMQAQGGTAALASRPRDTRAALDTIVETGRASLADLRHVLPATGPAATHPPPGLARLAQLVAQVRSSGTPVRLAVSGTPESLPTAVDLAAYRIVQEALTNTMKHAGPGASAQVSVTCGETEVLVEVTDDGTGLSRADGPGSGLRGMRERVAVLGGSISAGPGPRGFEVRARLPCAGGSP